MQEVEALAPIVWSIDDEGNEFIKVRNGSGGSAHVSRYTFLEHNLPIDMDFLVDNGKQYILMGRKKLRTQTLVIMIQSLNMMSNISYQRVIMFGGIKVLKKMVGSYSFVNQSILKNGYQRVTRFSLHHQSGE